MEIKEIEGFISKIPDHPKPGILFYDISTLVIDNEAFGESLRLMCDSISKLDNLYTKVEALVEKFDTLHDAVAPSKFTSGSGTERGLG